MRPLLLLLLALPAAAQPSPGDVVEAWLGEWRRAGGGGAQVVADESAVWTVDGPRGLVEVEADGTLAWGDGRPERRVERLVVNGRPVDARRADRTGERWRRAFGPPGREVLRPPRLPDRPLADGVPREIAADEIDGVPAWRVTFEGGGEAWFSRQASPRLLRVRIERRPGRGRERGRLISEVRYARIDGLDLPVASETRLTVRQRRRLRDYFVTLTASAGYSGHVVR